MEGDSRQIAVFMDVENIRRGAEEALPGQRFRPKKIIDFIGRYGRVVVRNAYADWSRKVNNELRAELMASAMNMLQTFPLTRHNDKNGADIRMAVDAMEVLFTRPEINHYFIVASDSDFTGVINKLREWGKYVTGIGTRHNANRYLINSCDRFVFYSQIVLEMEESEEVKSRVLNTVREEVSLEDARKLLTDALEGALGDGSYARGGLVKDHMRRRDNTFDQTNYGYRTFREFLEGQSDLIGVEYAEELSDLRVSFKKDVRASRRSGGERSRGGRRRRSSGRGAEIAKEILDSLPESLLPSGDQRTLTLSGTDYKIHSAKLRKSVINELYNLFSDHDPRPIEATVREVAGKLEGVSQRAVSQIIKVLRDADALFRPRRGRGLALSAELRSERDLGDAFDRFVISGMRDEMPSITADQVAAVLYEGEILNKRSVCQMHLDAIAKEDDDNGDTPAPSNGVTAAAASEEAAAENGDDEGDEDEALPGHQVLEDAAEAAPEAEPEAKPRSRSRSRSRNGSSGRRRRSS